MGSSWQTKRILHLSIQGARSGVLNHSLWTCSYGPVYSDEVSLFVMMNPLVGGITQNNNKKCVIDKQETMCIFSVRKNAHSFLLINHTLLLLFCLISRKLCAFFSQKNAHRFLLINHTLLLLFCLISMKLCAFFLTEKCT